MLILTRRPNEKLIIGGNEISVTLLEIRGGRVRIGISAPDDVSIRRAEVPAEAVAEKHSARSARCLVTSRSDSILD